jgi:hypothetical protein
VFYLQQQQQRRLHANVDKALPLVSLGILSRRSLHAEMSLLRMPVLLMYGDHDWLRYSELEVDAAKWKAQGSLIYNLMKVDVTITLHCSMLCRKVLT